jgi:5-methylcytosine-specific restriction endonuclease McrA
MAYKDKAKKQEWARNNIERVRAIQARSREKRRAEIRAKANSRRLINHNELLQREREYRVLHHEKIIENHRRWNNENRDKLRAKQKIYAARMKDTPQWKQSCKESSLKHYREHQAEILERARQKRIANIEIFRNRDKIRAQKYPEYYRFKSKIRRARHYTAQGTHTYEQWLSRVEYFDWLCVYCKKELGLTTLTQDHKIPLSRGGSNWPANLVPACKSCNSAKSTKTYLEYMDR